MHAQVENMAQIPHENSPGVQEFFRQREALISRENEQRSDYDFRQSLSPVAKQAHEIVAKIRLEEHASIWARDVTSSENEELYPGMIFNSAKNHMENTRLWQIVRKMPKGALLHCHLGATVDLEWVFNKAVETPGMVISSDRPLNSPSVRDVANVKVEFSKDGKEDADSIWLSKYVEGMQIPLEVAAVSFPDGGRHGFCTWLKNLCSISQTDSVEHHLGVDAIWRKLQKGFVLITPVVFYEPITRAFLRKLFNTLKEDGVKWVEMRGGSRGFRLEGQTGVVEGRLELSRVIHEEVEKFTNSEEGKGFWGCRQIWDSMRSFDTGAIVEDMTICLQAKKLYPETISGYDLVGPEDFGRTLHSLTPEIVWFKQQLTAQNLNIPFFFHAGECLGSGSPTDHNLYDAILFGTRRIGHAFSLYKHPLLIGEVKSKNILVESCPISNEVLRYSASVLSHPLPALLSRGVKCSLSNDDPALMGVNTSGVSHDFWQALQGWDSLGLAGLGSLAQNSIRWSAFDDQTDEEWQKDIKEGENGKGIRAQRLKEWNADWEVFCQWIVDTYA